MNLLRNPLEILKKIFDEMSGKIFYRKSQKSETVLSMTFFVQDIESGTITGHFD